MGKYKDGSVGQQIMQKFGWSMPIYCEQRNLKYKSFARGYFSQRAKIVLDTDGINILSNQIKTGNHEKTN